MASCDEHMPAEPTKLAGVDRESGSQLKTVNGHWIVLPNDIIHLTQVFIAPGWQAVVGSPANVVQS